MPLFNFDEDSLALGIQSENSRGLQLTLRMVMTRLSAENPQDLSRDVDMFDEEPRAQLQYIQEIMASSRFQGKSYVLHVAALMTDEALNKTNRVGWGNILIFMLKLGCNPNQQDKESRNTLAHYAALAGDSEVAKYLKQTNCESWNVLNIDSQSPYDIARAKYPGDIFLHTAFSTSSSSQFFSYSSAGARQHHGYAPVAQMEVSEGNEDDDEGRITLNSREQSQSSCFKRLFCCGRS